MLALSWLPEGLSPSGLARLLRTENSPPSGGLSLTATGDAPGSRFLSVPAWP